MKKSASFIIRLLFLLFTVGCITSLNLSAQTSTSGNNAQYLYPAFSEGQVKMKNGKNYTASMNYSTVSQCMVMNKDGKLLELTNMQSVDTVILNNRLFTPFGDAFYEVVVNGKLSLFIQHKSNLVETGSNAGYGTTTKTSAVRNYSSMNTRSKTFNMELPPNNSVEADDVNWIRLNNSMLSFTNKRQLLKLFPEKSSDIDKFMKQNRLNLTEYDDLIKLGRYLNSLSW